MTSSVSFAGERDEYLNHNVLHNKPISAHLFSQAQHLHLHFSKIHTQMEWKQRTVKILSTLFIIASHTLVILAASIEAAAAAAIGIMGILVQFIFCKDSDLVEKHTIKILAYSLHGFQVCIIAAIALCNIRSIHDESQKLFPKTHLHLSYLNGITYLSISALVQLFGTKLFNLIRGEQNDAPINRCNQAIIEGLPPIFSECAQSIEREYQAFNNEEAINPARFAQNFIESSPPASKDWIEDFDLADFINTQAQAPLQNLIEEFINQYNFIKKTDIVDRSENEVTLDPFNESEKQYHEHLKECVKEAVGLMINNQWAKYLHKANNFEKGKKMLSSLDASCTIPLANIAQIVELEKPIACPKAFGYETLIQYDDRQKDLSNLKQTLEQLSEKDKELLVERLIKGSLFDLGERILKDKQTVDQLCNAIGKLSGSLHQGTLLTLPTLNTQNLEAGGHNYFGVCWGEACEI